MEDKNNRNENYAPISELNSDINKRTNFSLESTTDNVNVNIAYLTTGQTELQEKNKNNNK